MNFSKLFSPKYLFEIYPGSEFRYMIPLIVFFLILVVGSIYLEQWIKKNPDRKHIQSLLPGIVGRLRLLGLMGFIFLWVRYENLPYLSMRIFLMAYLIYILWVISQAVYKMKKILPMLIDEGKIKKTEKNYLPQKKKNKKKKKR